MTPLEELTLKLADDAITDAECQELQTLLAEDPKARSAHIKILQIEAALRAGRQGLKVAGPVMKSLRGDVADAVARTVMTQIKMRPVPEWRRKRVPNWLTWGAPFPFSASGIRLLLARAWLPIAVCFTLAIGFGVLYFNPTVGEPALEGVQGSGLDLERAGQRIPASVGLRLQPGDRLRTPEHVTAVIGYAPENTRLKLLPGTELTLTARARGKLFALELGKLEAVVSRQTPFCPMIISTPQAQARIVGTRFTLTVTTNSTRLDVTKGKVQFTRLSDEKFVPVSAGHYAMVAPDFDLAALPFTGSILREYWTNVPGAFCTVYLTSNTNYPDHPSGRDYLSRLETFDNWGTNYGARIRGYLLPPATGDYTFWITAEDGGELYLSPDDNPDHRQEVATWEGPDGNTQQSTPLPLKAGCEYYIQVLQKTGNADSHLAIDWQGPGRNREVISGEFLSPWKPK